MMQMFRRMTPKDWGFYALSVLLLFLQVFLELKIPDYLAVITRLTQQGGPVTAAILQNGGKMLAVSLLSLLCAFGVSDLYARVAAAFSGRLRQELFEKVMHFSAPEMDVFSVSGLITRSTVDVSKLQEWITVGLQMLIKAPLLAVWALIKMAGKGSAWTLATAVAVGIMVGMIALLFWLLAPRFQKIQRLNDHMNQTVREQLQGMPVIRAYQAEEYQEQKFQQVSQALFEQRRFTNAGLALVMSGMQAVLNGLTLAIYWIGARALQDAAEAAKLMLFSDTVAFSSYAAQVLLAFMMLMAVILMIPEGMVSARRIAAVLNTTSPRHTGHRTHGLPGLEGQVEFRHVSFSYAEGCRPILRELTFVVAPGTWVGIIGATGSGKSSLLQLIPRLYEATGGEVLVDGLPVRSYKPEALWGKIAYVSQMPVLFSGTVLYNLCIGEGRFGPIEREDAEEALKIASAAEFVCQREGGLLGTLTAGGADLSGGQRQRLGLARALCRKPEIYLLDDCFSALDAVTERQVRADLLRKLNDATVFLVSQRMQTLMDADRIIVLDQGTIVGQGTHAELLRTCPVYQEIAASQPGGEMQ